MMSKKKLYTLTSKDFKFPLYVFDGKPVITSKADDIPMLSWPDGTWCIFGNCYMLELYQRGLSRRNRGGTLHTYATNISHLIRYTFNNNIYLPDITDAEFSFFIKCLQGEHSMKNPGVAARDSNSVLAIGRQCLDFIACIGRLMLNETIIGPQGQIKAREIKVSRKNTNFGKRSQEGFTKWHHRSFPTPDPFKLRQPISSEDITKLREAIFNIKSSIFVRKRRYVMLKLLEITGGRRSEIASLRVNDILHALEMPTPLLKLMTLKRGANEYRFIPIAKHDLLFLSEFITVNRKRIIRQTCGTANDQGFLLISETSGYGLRPNTITQELSTLANEANLKTQSCPHTFRHRFITKLFIALAEQHQLSNPDNFRRVLIDTERMKQQIQQWTGHKNIHSLDRYITLAFDELVGFNQTYKTVTQKMSIDSLKSTIATLTAELQSGESIEVVSHRIGALLSAAADELE